MSEVPFDDARRGQLRQRLRTLRLLVADAGEGAEIATRLAELELHIRRATAIEDEPVRWVRELDDIIASVESGSANDAALEQLLQEIASALRTG